MEGVRHASQPICSAHARLFQDSSQQLAPIISPSNKAWDYRVEPFKLPPYTRLMLADVDAGSDTPSLVGRVLKWRKENSEDAKARWDALDALNQKLSRVLLHLSEEEATYPTAYRKAVKYISTIQSVQVGRVPPSVSREARSTWNAHHRRSVAREPEHHREREGQRLPAGHRSLRGGQPDVRGTPALPRPLRARL